MQAALQDEHRRSGVVLGPSLDEHRTKTDPEISGQTAFRYPVGDLFFTTFASGSKALSAPFVMARVTLLVLAKGSYLTELSASLWGWTEGVPGTRGPHPLRLAILAFLLALP